MPDNSFDIVSKIELPEVSNAVQQAMKEIQQRYDLKDSRSSIELKEKENKIILQSADDFKLKAVTDILQGKLVKRNVPLKGLAYGTITPSAGSTVKQEITLQQGIATEKAKDIVKVAGFCWTISRWSCTCSKTNSAVCMTLSGYGLTARTSQWTWCDRPQTGPMAPRPHVVEFREPFPRPGRYRA